jgi:predicted ATP-grasp superfamily ATP-dependent carboligase
MPSRSLLTPDRERAAAPVVVLKFDPNVMHHGGLGIIRSLGRFGVPVIGIHEGRFAPAAHSRYVVGRCYWMPSTEDIERTIDGLHRIAQWIGQPSVLIPTDDAGSIFLAEHGDELGASYLFPRPPTDLPRRVAGKFSLHELCEKLELPSPASSLPESLEEAFDFAARWGYPLVAKLATPWTGGHGRLRSTTIVGSREELVELDRVSTRRHSQYMLQEFLPGEAGDDWFAHGYCDASSRCAPIFTGVKERSYPAHAGLTSFGRAAPNPRLAAFVADLMSAISYRGIFDLDLRYDRRDDSFKLLDFNPRIGAQFRLFRDATGLDVALAQYLDLTGHPITPSAQVDGRNFVVENYDPLGALAYWKNGELTLREWASSLRGVDEVAWFAFDDIVPFGLMCARMGWRLLTRPLALRVEQRHDGGPHVVSGRAARHARRAAPAGAVPRGSTRLDEEARTRTDAA